jgi:hypothetical protein
MFYGNHFRGLWKYVWFRCLITSFVNTVANWATRHGIPFYVSTWYNINNGFTADKIETMSKQYLEWARQNEKEDD